MRRWLFAVMSYQNTWRNNVKAFRYVDELGYPLHRFGRKGLARHVMDSRSGLHERRTHTLYTVSCGLWESAGSWKPWPAEHVSDFRTRLLSRNTGLVYAKLSFVLEMLYPEAGMVVCVDRHMFELYGIEKGGRTPATYALVEKHWVETCKDLRLPATIARHIWWDQLRDPVEWSTRYWSHVLEDRALAAAGYYDVPRHRRRKPLVV